MWMYTARSESNEFIGEYSIAVRLWPGALGPLPPVGIKIWRAGLEVHLLGPRAAYNAISTMIPPRPGDATCELIIAKDSTPPCGTLQSYALERRTRVGFAGKPEAHDGYDKGGYVGHIVRFGAKSSRRLGVQGSRTV